MDIARFGIVATSVSDLLATWPRPADEISALCSSLTQGEVPDYSVEALHFALAYWVRNFWKAAYFFGYEFRSPSLLLNRFLVADGCLEVLVLGAGSGADTVACMAWLDETLPLQRIKLTLLDRSPEQLALARSILDRALSVLNRARFEINYLVSDLDDWNPMADSIDLILMGHVLTENPRFVEQLVVKTVSVLKPRGDLIMIERLRDPIWLAARDSYALRGVTTHDVKLDAKFSQLIPALPSEQTDMTPSYVKASMPSNKKLQSLVSAYFEAWVGQSSDNLDRIFTVDATYDEKPCIEPIINGLDGIRRYWDEHPGRQRNVQLKVHNVAYSDTVSVCSWSGEFDTPEQHISIRGAMNFYLDSCRGKINRFDEWFGTQKSVLKT